MSDISEFVAWEQENRSLESEEKSQQEQRRREFSHVNCVDSSSDDRSEDELPDDAENTIREEARRRAMAFSGDRLDRSWREVTSEASSKELEFGTQEVFQQTYGRVARYMSTRNTKEEDCLDGPVAFVGTLHNRTPGDVVSEGNWGLASESSQGEEEEEHPDFVAPPSSQPRQQSEIDEVEVDGQSDTEDLPPMAEEDLAMISDVLEEFDFPEAREDVAWTFAEAPPEEIENLRRVSIGLPPKELEREQRRDQLGIQVSDLYNAFDFTGSSAGDEISGLEKAPTEEIQILQNLLTGSPSREFSDWTQSRTYSKSMFESVDEYVQQHPFFLQADDPSFEQQRVNFEKDVYKFAKRVGMGSHRAKVEVWKARSAFKRKVGLGNGTILDVDGSEQEEAIPLQPSVILRRAVDVYPNYDPETSYSNTANVAPNFSLTGNWKRKLVDMSEEERTEMVAKRRKKGVKKARKVDILQGRKVDNVDNLAKAFSTVPGQTGNFASNPKIVEHSVPKKINSSPPEAITEVLVSPESKEKKNKKKKLQPAPATSAYFTVSQLPSPDLVIAAGVGKFGPKPPSMSQSAWKSYKKRHVASQQLSSNGTIEEVSVLPNETSESALERISLQTIKDQRMSKTKQERKVKQLKQSVQVARQAPLLHDVTDPKPLTTGNRPLVELHEDTEKDSTKRRKKNRKKKRNKNRLSVPKTQNTELSQEAGKAIDSTSHPHPLSQKRPRCTSFDESQPNRTKSISFESKRNIDGTLSSSSTPLKYDANLATKEDNSKNEVDGALSELHNSNATKTKIARRDRGRKSGTVKPLGSEVQPLDEPGKAIHS